MCSLRPDFETARFFRNARRQGRIGNQCDRRASILRDTGSSIVSVTISSLSPCVMKESSSFKVWAQRTHDMAFLVYPLYTRLSIFVWFSVRVTKIITFEVNNKNDAMRVTIKTIFTYQVCNKLQSYAGRKPFDFTQSFVATLYSIGHSPLLLTLGFILASLYMGLHIT